MPRLEQFVRRRPQVRAEAPRRDFGEPLRVHHLARTGDLEGPGTEGPRAGHGCEAGPFVVSRTHPSRLIALRNSRICPGASPHASCFTFALAAFRIPIGFGGSFPLTFRSGSSFCAFPTSALAEPGA